MLRILARILNVLVLLLAVSYGLLMVSVVAVHGPLAEETPEVVSAVRQDTEDDRTLMNPLQWVLSKLPLSPFFRRDIQLVAVVIENQEDARPHQHGLNEALMVEEWVVEGYITRFIALFDAENLPAIAGPVRSIRPYFIHGLLPWHTLLLHAGGSPEAYEAAQSTDIVTAVNGLAGNGYEYFERDDDIPAPHNLFITKENMQAIHTDHDAPTMEWPPYKTSTRTDGEAATSIAVNFYSYYHNISYSYDSRMQQYIRTNGATEQQASPRNVLFLEMPVVGVGEYGRLNIPVEGEGPLLLFRNGVVIHGTWQKEDDTVPFTFLNTEGEPLQFAQGQLWMTVLPWLDRISWENGEAE